MSVKNSRLFIVALAVCAAGRVVGAPEAEQGAEIDFRAPAGAVKALSGVNGAPSTAAARSELFRAGVPAVRTEVLAGAFPDFDADENDAAAYAFAPADTLLKQRLAGSPARIVLAFGEPSRPLRGAADCAKWARVSARLAARYLDGPKAPLRQKDVFLEVAASGTAAPAYAETARLLKKRFPACTVGFGAGSLSGEAARAAFAGFLRAALPVRPAFCSWRYDWADEPPDFAGVRRLAGCVRTSLDAAGLTSCASVLDGWNCALNGFRGRKEMFGASFAANMFCLLQAAPVDGAFYRDADPASPDCGLFEPVEETTTPCFEAFLAWNGLRRAGAAVRSAAAAPSLGVAAAADGRRKAFLLANAFERARLVRVKVEGVSSNDAFTVYCLGGKNRRLAAVGVWRPGETISLPPYGVALAATAFDAPRQILIAGDSLLEERVGATSYGSWGQQLASALAPGVVIDNLAASGTSSKSFVDSGRWGRLLTRIRKGDWVIVQFGHNDVAKDPNRHTDLATFRRNFERFADDIAARGGHAVFASPTSCWMFDRRGRLANKPYLPSRAQAVREAAAAKGALFVDMSALTAKALQDAGRDATRDWFMIGRIGNADSMHTTRLGARRFAALFVENVKASASPFAELFR